MKVDSFLRLARPGQWAKNSLLFAGYIFSGSFKQETAARDFAMIVIAFIRFCALSAFVYTINDILDREADIQHPGKRSRPLAAGEITVSQASVFAFTALTLGWVLGLYNPFGSHSHFFLFGIVLYPVWGVVYSFWLKRVVIVDVLAVAVGFVVRVASGCWAISVEISEWLLLCTLFLALFIALCKRRHELLLMGDQASHVRAVLPQYSPQLLDVMIGAVAAKTLMAYCLYTFLTGHMLLSSSAQLNGEQSLLMWTIPLVICGVFRYLFLAYRTDVAGTPETMLRDRPLVLCVIVWVIVVAVLGLFAR